MKKIVLIFGLISGLLMAAFMFGTLSIVNRIGFDKGVFFGYTGIVLAFILVFFGIRSYRENVGGGSISFGRAFAVGILITVISTVCYVISWEIIYFNFMPDFADKYSAYVMEQERRSGASPEALQAKAQEMKDMKGYLDNPITNAALTFLEPFPVGLIITLISSLILRRRPKRLQSTEPAPA